jgi:hypothetical protein
LGGCGCVAGRGREDADALAEALAEAIPEALPELLGEALGATVAVGSGAGLTIGALAVGASAMVADGGGAPALASLEPPDANR